MSALRVFYVFFMNQLKSSKAAIISFSILSVILVGLLSFLSIKGSFSSQEFFSSFGLVVWLMIGLTCTNVAGGIGIRDFDEKAGLLILSQPVKRYIILSARLLASVLVVLLPVSMMYIAGWILGYSIYSTSMNNVLLSYSIAFLYAFSFSSLIAMAGTISRRKADAINIGLSITLLSVFVFAVLENFFGIEPWFFLPYAGLAIGNALIVPYPAHVNPGSYFFRYTPYVQEAVLIMAVYAFFSLIMAFLVYSRRELVN